MQNNQPVTTDRLSDGAVGGISVGAAAFVVLAAATVYLVRQKKLGKSPCVPMIAVQKVK